MSTAAIEMADHGARQHPTEAVRQLRVLERARHDRHGPAQVGVAGEARVQRRPHRLGRLEGDDRRAREGGVQMDRAGTRSGTEIEDRAGRRVDARQQARQRRAELVPHRGGEKVVELGRRLAVRIIGDSDPPHGCIDPSYARLIR